MEAKNVPVPGAFSANREFALGAEFTDTSGAKWVYVKAETDISQYAACAVNRSTWVAAALTKALADNGHIIAFAQVAIDGTPDPAYGWLQVTGRPTVLTGSGVNGSVALYTTGTAGRLDDSATSQTLLHGIRVAATVAGSNIGRVCNVSVPVHV